MAWWVNHDRVQNQKANLSCHGFVVFWNTSGSMVVFVAYVLWVISRCLYKSLADMTDSNSAPGNHGRLKPWLRTSQQKPPAGPPSTHHLGWFQRGHQRMVLAAAVRLRSTLDREVGFHHLQTENGDGDICWRRWGWHVEEEPVGVVFFHRISMNFMWMSNDEAYQLISPWNLENTCFKYHSPT